MEQIVEDIKRILNGDVPRVRASGHYSAENVAQYFDKAVQEVWNRRMKKCMTT